MLESSYIKKIEQLLYNYKAIKFSTIRDLEFVKGVNFDPVEYRHLADSIRRNGINAVKVLDTEKKSSEDLTVYKFSDQSGRNYLVAIYDSDELWQDPEILDIFSC